MNDILPIADRIDARFTAEPTAKREEVDALKADNAELQARLDASMPLPVDADGVPCRIGDLLETEEHIPRKAVGYYLADESTPCVTLDFVSTSIEASQLHHVAPKPIETIEDVRKSCDNTVAYLASVSGMGWHDVGTFSEDVHKQLDRAYACGKRDGAGEQR